MSDVPTHPSEPQSAGERLLEDSWEARARRASRRELMAEAAVGALFVAAAGSLLMLSGALGSVRPGAAALLVVLYAIVARIEFPVGAGHVVPSQLVLVPMLVVLPAGAVPVAVALGLLAGTTVDWAFRRVPARRLLSAIPDAWHALGPALVLVAAGSPDIDFNELPLMSAAFAACCATDLVSSLARMRLVRIMPDMKAFAGVMLTVWAVDACLAPLGFLAAEATTHGLAAVLFVLPLAGLLWLLARDRSSRIEQAHARLRLVEHERGRLRSAVRRLGDAFAAKLELDSLLEILLHGSIEALDAGAGRLELVGLPVRRHLQAGPAGELDGVTAGPGGRHGAVRDGFLSIAIRIPGQAHPVTGTLQVARDGRAFDDDEIALLRELVAKAEQAAAEILAHQALHQQTVTDALTGLGNRRRLSRDLAAALERAASDRATLLLLFDLDGFKTYNDTFGHLAGDQLLARLGAKLTEAVGPHGGAYRLGGDEFCALLDLDHAGDIDELIARTAAALTESGTQFAIGASLGAVLLPHEADSPDHAVQLADERMYASKRSRADGPRHQARDVLMRTMQARQPDLDEHASEVAGLAIRVARRLGLGGEALDELARAAELHDVGKVGIPDAILSKPAALDPHEWEFIHQHTVLGERILNAAPALRSVARLVRASHERWDGSGYPDQLAGEDIPLGARIVAVCDAYSAMTADRPYRNALSHNAARQELRANAGTQFDPVVVEAFLTTVDDQLVAYAPDTAIHSAAAHIHTLFHAPAPSPVGATITDSPVRRPAEPPAVT